MSYDRSAQILDEDVVFRFFWRFSVFECALKREGFLKKGMSIAAPDWDAFAAAIGGRFPSVLDPGFKESVVAIQALTPKRQVVRNERLEWEPINRQNNESDEAYTLRLLRTVRNNLFHGGKYPDGPIDELARNREILAASIAVLDGCFELHPGMQRWASEAA